MKHFIAYHNAVGMGYSAEESDPRGLYTSKRLSNPTGDIIWIVTGDGKSPKTYRLASWFAVDKIEPSDLAKFGSMLSGAEGGALDPMPVLNDLDWFPDFFKKMAHFSLGLQQIKQAEIIDALMKLASDAGRPVA